MPWHIVNFFDQILQQMLPLFTYRWDLSVTTKKIFIAWIPDGFGSLQALFRVWIPPEQADHESHWPQFPDSGPEEMSLSRMGTLPPKRPLVSSIELFLVISLQPENH